jgi:hypothetical protein
MTSLMGRVGDRLALPRLRVDALAGKDAWFTFSLVSDRRCNAWSSHPHSHADRRCCTLAHKSLRSVENPLLEVPTLLPMEDSTSHSRATSIQNLQFILSVLTLILFW